MLATTAKLGTEMFSLVRPEDRGDDLVFEIPGEVGPTAGSRMILLDTNVVSEPTKPRPDANVRAWIDAQPASTLFICARRF